MWVIFYDKDVLNEIIIFPCKTIQYFLKGLDFVYMVGTFNYYDNTMILHTIIRDSWH